MNKTVLTEKGPSLRQMLILQVIAGVLICAMIFVVRACGSSVTFDLSESASEYMDVVDGRLVLDQDLSGISGTDDLFESGVIGLRTGSYTVTVRYTSDQPLEFTVFSYGNGRFLKANPFRLSSNKNSVEYDLYLTRNVNDIAVRATDLSDGDLTDLTISEISIRENDHALRCLLAVYICAAAAADLWFFNDRIKKNRMLILELIGIALIPSLELFMEGVSYGHDYGFHLARIEGISQGLLHGDFPVRNMLFFNDDYGYPVSVFYGDLLLYIPAIMRVIGFTVNTAYKLYVILINLLTTISCYLLCKDLFRNKIALAATAVYVTANYRLLDVFVRTAVGEYTAMIFFPIIALAVFREYSDADGSEWKNSILLAVGMTGLIFSHTLSAEMTVVILALTALFFFRRTFRKKTIFMYIKAVLFTLFAGATFIVPFLDYYLNTDTNIKAINEYGRELIQYRGAYISDYFAFFRDYFGGASANVTERMQTSPGPILMLALIFGICFVIRGKSDLKMRYALIGSAVTLFISSDLFPWDHIAAASGLGNSLAQVQFPWRYLVFAVLFMTILFGSVIEKGIEYKAWGDKIIVAVVVFCLINNCFLISQLDEKIVQDCFMDSAELPQYTYYSTDPSDATLYSVEYMILGAQVEDLECDLHVNGMEGHIIRQDGLDISVEVNGGAGSYLEVPRFCYPNYIAKDMRGKTYPISMGENGRVRVTLDSDYTGEIDIRYVEPWHWRVSEIVTAISVAGMVYLYIYESRKQKAALSE